MSTNWIMLHGIGKNFFYPPRELELADNFSSSDVSGGVLDKANFVI